VTGYLVKWFGWRTAFVVPGLVSIACGLLFAWLAQPETEPPARRTSKAKVALTQAQLARAFLVMTAAAATGGILFNMTTNANTQLMAERFRGVLEDPALLGLLLALVYAVASLAQVVVGRLIDRHALRPLYVRVALLQVPLLLLAAYAQGWFLFAALIGVMVTIFGAIPFTDAMIVRYVDDRLRSRVAGMRLAVGLGISSVAVWALGPVVKGVGFATLLLVLAGIASITAAVVNFLPDEG